MTTKVHMHGLIRCSKQPKMSTTDALLTHSQKYWLAALHVQVCLG